MAGVPLSKSSHQILLVLWRSLAPNQSPAYLLLVLCQSFLLLDKLLSKAKECYLPLAKGLLALAKGATRTLVGGSVHIPEVVWSCAYPTPVPILVYFFLMIGIWYYSLPGHNQ